MFGTVSRPIYLFTLKEIPVFVDVWYLGLMGYYLFLSGGGLQLSLIWCVCVTLSLLIHEFGHGLVARHYSLKPQVMLHAFGGLCSHDRAQRDRHDVWIIAAGPGIELVFGGLIWGAREMILHTAPAFFVQYPLAWTVAHYLIYINVFWALVNLVPLFPLDGGQLFRIGLMKLLKPLRAERIVAVVGIALCVVGVIVWPTPLIAIICLFLGIENLRVLRGDTVLAGPRRHNNLAADLFTRAEEALKSGDPQEAARLCHQVRSERNVDPRVLDRVWEVLTVATIAQDRFEEGLRFSRFAEDKPPVVAAKLRALLALGRTDEAQALFESDAVRKFPPALRDELSAALNNGFQPEGLARDATRG